MATGEGDDMSEAFTGQRTAREIAERMVEEVESSAPLRAVVYRKEAIYWKEKYKMMRRELRRSNKALENLVWKLRAKEKL
jgi:hypothetical protein